MNFKSKILIILLGIVLLYISSSCEDPPFVEKFYGIRVVNNSSIDIRVHIADEHYTAQYPDTLLPLEKPARPKTSPGGTAYFDSKTPWEENLNELPADTLSIFIIANEDYEQKSWQEIRDNYLVLKRFDLSIEDLQSANYKVNYP